MVEPLYGLVHIDLDGGRVGVGVVDPEFFQELSIALGPRVGGYDPVKGFAFFTVSLKSYSNWHITLICGVPDPGY
jgi:hypothetical protein